MKALWSWIRHWLRWNTGTVTTEWRGDDLWIGFGCDCGEVHHWHRTKVTRARRPAA